MQLRPAQKSKSKLRIGFSGPSGSGKTYSALLLASGMAPWEKICVIDTENMSADLYSDLGAYNVITLDSPYTPERYIQAIKDCEEGGMEVIIIDSVTHEWDGEGGALQINQKLADTKFRGNTWAAWSETTPRHQKFIYAITMSKCHIITTARAKTDTIQTDDKKIKKVGLKEIQREGYEYELTANFTIDRDSHYAIASKDRTGMFIDSDPFIITDEVGKRMLAWANTGMDPRDLAFEVADLLRTKQTTQTIESICRIYKVEVLNQVGYHDLLALRNKLKSLADRPKEPETPTAPPKVETPKEPSAPVSEPPVTPQEPAAVSEPAAIPMASAGDVVMFTQLIKRRAEQSGKTAEAMTKAFLTKMKVEDVKQLTKEQITKTNDMLTQINTEYVETHKADKPASLPPEEEDTIAVGMDVFGGDAAAEETKPVTKSKSKK